MLLQDEENGRTLEVFKPVKKEMERQESELRRKDLIR
jgi:hypothetical protein